MGADLLGETLAAFKFKEFNIADFQLGAPWAISTKGFPPGVNLIVVEGACWFRLPDGRDVRLRAGQSVLVPRGGDLIFASDLELRAALVTEVWEEEQLRELSEEPATLHERHWGGDGDLCRILGFAFELEETAEEQLLPHLPETIIVDNTVPTQLRQGRALPRGSSSTNSGVTRCRQNMRLAGLPVSDTGSCKRRWR
jgi:hypothetical protein